MLLMKTFLKILFILFIFLQLSSVVWAQEQIQSFDTKIVINKDGTIDVKERIVYDFGTLEKHGIHRDVPFVKTNKQGKKFKLDFSNFSVTDENNNSYRFTKSTNNQQLTFKIGDPNKTITGLHTYIISYKVSGALTYFSDHDELYWNATGNEWTVPIVHSTSGVGLPVGAAQGEISATCFTGSEGSTSRDCEINKTDNFVTFKANSILESNQGLTVVVGFPKNIVSVLEPRPYAGFWETNFGKIVIAVIILAAFLWYIVYPIWIPIKWLRQGRDPSTSSGQARAWFDPPKTKPGRPLTPEETGALVDERADMEDISGMIVLLAQKGYIKIEEKQKGDFYFVKRKDFSKAEDLLAFEETFLYGLFKDGDKFHLKKSKLYDLVETVKTNIYQRLVSEGFFLENPNKVRGFYTIIGGLALTTFNFALAFSAFFFGRHMPKKTPSGVETKNVAKSLKNFLSSQERQLEFQAKNQVFFEKLLPYAVVFGVEKIWAERFKDIQMRPPDWYSGYGSARFNSVYFTNSLNSSFSSFQSATTPVTSSTGHGSGFSGGSSGGGGGGGGGGGSW